MRRDDIVSIACSVVAIISVALIAVSIGRSTPRRFVADRCVTQSASRAVCAGHWEE